MFRKVEGGAYTDARAALAQLGTAVNASVAPEGHPEIKTLIDRQMAKLVIG